MAKRFYEICETDPLYRVNIIRNNNDITLETEELQAALDVKIYDDNIKLFCYNLSKRKNVIVTFNCETNDNSKYVMDDAGVLKYFITSSKRKMNEFINSYRENNPDFNIIVNNNIQKQ